MHGLMLQGVRRGFVKTRPLKTQRRYPLGHEEVMDPWSADTSAKRA
jgi:hypothetical protein